MIKKTPGFARGLFYSSSGNIQRIVMRSDPVLHSFAFAGKQLNRPLVVRLLSPQTLDWISQGRPNGLVAHGGQGDHDR